MRCFMSCSKLAFSILISLGSLHVRSNFGLWGAHSLHDRSRRSLSCGMCMMEEQWRTLRNVSAVATLGPSSSRSALVLPATEEVVAARPCRWVLA